MRNLLVDYVETFQPKRAVFIGIETADRRRNEETFS